MHSSCSVFAQWKVKTWPSHEPGPDLALRQTFEIAPAAHRSVLSSSALMGTNTWTWTTVSGVPLCKSGRMSTKVHPPITAQALQMYSRTHPSRIRFETNALARHRITTQAVGPIRWQLDVREEVPHRSRLRQVGPPPSPGPSDRLLRVQRVAVPSTPLHPVVGWVEGGEF